MPAALLRDGRPFAVGDRSRLFGFRDAGMLRVELVRRSRDLRAQFDRVGTLVGEIGDVGRPGYLSLCQRTVLAAESGIELAEARLPLAGFVRPLGRAHGRGIQLVLQRASTGIDLGRPMP